MARPKAFDPELALEQAMRLFWCRGYDGTSVQDIVEALGISRASLYGTFGGKHELYLAALDRYRQREAGGLVAALDAADDAPAAIAALLRSLVTEAADDPSRRGCMMVNAVTECAGRDPAATARAHATFGDIEAAIGRALTRARDRGHVPADIDVHITARFLVTTINGLRVGGQAGTSHAQLEQVVDLALAAIR